MDFALERRGLVKLERRGLVKFGAAISKFVGAACVVLLSFWGALQVLDYFNPSGSGSGTVPWPQASGSSKAVYLFDKTNAHVSDLHFVRDADTDPQGTKTAILLDDRSP